MYSQLRVHTLQLEVDFENKEGPRVGNTCGFQVHAPGLAERGEINLSNGFCADILTPSRYKRDFYIKFLTLLRGLGSNIWSLSRSPRRSKNLWDYIRK